MKKVMGGLVTLLLIVVGIYFYQNQNDHSKTGLTILETPRHWQGFYYETLDDYLDAFNLPKEKVDQESFTLLHDGLAYDKNSIYYFREVMENSGKAKIAELHSKLIERYKESYNGPDKELWDIGTFQVLDIDNAYARDKNNAYHGGYQLKNFDPKLMQILELGIYTDGKNLYWALDKIDALAKNFQVLDHGYAKDNNKVFVQSFFRILVNIEKVNAKTFEVINRSFSRDKNGFFFNDIRLVNIDIDTFKAFQRYGVDKNRAYFFLNRMQMEIINSIDYNTFKEVADYYAKDKNHVYYQGMRVPDADPASFAFNKHGIPIDKKYVFMGENIIITGDRDSYRDIARTGYSVDKSHLYYGGKRMLGADPDSFEVLADEKYNDVYVRDNHRVYKQGKPIEELDPATFEIIQGNWLKDKDNVFYNMSRISEADSATFEVLEKEYARDKNNLYHIFAGSYKVIESISDPATFQIINERYSRDKDYVYYNHVSEFYQLDGVKPESFEYLVMGYFRDKDRIYFKEDTSFFEYPFIVDADADSFEIVEMPLGEHKSDDDDYIKLYMQDYGRDKNGCFDEGRRANCRLIINRRDY